MAKRSPSDRRPPAAPPASSPPRRGRRGGATDPAPDEPAGPAAPSRRPRQGAPRPTRVSEPVTLNLYEAKAHLSELVDRAAAGEEIVIAKAGTPLARLVPLPPPRLREPGGWEGKVWIAPDFDDPLPPEIQKYFDDPQIFPEEWDAEPRAPESER